MFISVLDLLLQLKMLSEFLNINWVSAFIWICFNRYSLFLISDIWILILKVVVCWDESCVCLSKEGLLVRLVPLMSIWHLIYSLSSRIYIIWCIIINISIKEHILMDWYLSRFLIIFLVLLLASRPLSWSKCTRLTTDQVILLLRLNRGFLRHQNF